MHDHGGRLAVEAICRIEVAGLEAEDRAVRRGVARGLAGRRLEGDAAQQHRLEGFGVHAKAGRIEPQPEAACMPPLRVPADVPVVGRLDEHVDRHARAILVQRGAGHLPDLDMAVVDGRSRFHRAERWPAQDETRALLAQAHHGRVFQAGELRFGFVRAAAVGADIGAGQQRAEAGGTAHAGTRAHDPEARAVGGEVGGLLVQLHRDKDAGQVRRQPDRRHHADVDVVVPDRRLAGLDAFAVLETEGDGRPVPAHLPGDEADAGQRRQHRHQPDEQLQPAEPMRRRMSGGVALAACDARQPAGPAIARSVGAGWLGHGRAESTRWSPSEQAQLAAYFSCATSASAPFSTPVLAALSEPMLAPRFHGLGYCLVT